MSHLEAPPPDDAHGVATDVEEPDDLLQEENAATSLDQPSDQSS
jgi:hypothetical protein